MASLKISAARMVQESRNRIEEIETRDLVGMVEDPDVIIVDIRDIRERQREPAPLIWPPGRSRGRQ